MKRCGECGSVSQDSDEKCGVCGEKFGVQGVRGVEKGPFINRMMISRRRLIGFVLLWGIVQLAVVGFEFISVPASFRPEFLPLESLIALAIAFAIGYTLEDFDSTPKVIIAGGAFAWLPILLLIILSQIFSGFLESVDGATVILLFFYGAWFFVVGLGGSVAGYGIQGWISANTRPSETLESVKELTDAELLDEYANLQSIISSGQNYSVIDSEFYSAIRIEIDRRKLQLFKSSGSNN